MLLWSVIAPRPRSAKGSRLIIALPLLVACGASGAADPYASGGSVANDTTSAQGGKNAAGGVGQSNPGTGGRASGGAATGGKGAAGSIATGGSSQGTLNPSITGSTGFATRYWDCCKPSCSWTTAVPACQKDGTTKISDRNAKSGCDSGGNAYECYDLAPWYDSSTNLSYGFAAYNGVSCGACFELQFTGEGQSGANDGATAIKGKQMIVQVINIGNITSGQFDLLIPGGGVGQMTAGCTAQWGSVDLGATYGGLLTECNGSPSCVTQKCASVFAGKPDLIAGCSWFTGWFAAADNPKVVYKQVSCPSQITSKTNVSG